MDGNNIRKTSYATEHNQSIMSTNSFLLLKKYLLNFNIYYKFYFLYTKFTYEFNENKLNSTRVLLII